MNLVAVTQPKSRQADRLIRARFPRYDSRTAGWLDPPSLPAGTPLDRFTLLQLRFVKSGRPERHALYAVGAFGQSDHFIGIEGGVNAALRFTWQELAVEGGWSLDLDFVPVSISNLAAGGATSTGPVSGGPTGRVT